MIGEVLALIILNAFFFILLWHLDVHHNLDRLGVKETRGFFNISSEKAYRLSQYGLVATIFLFDLLIVFLLFH